jgi:pimeloyl-ACP methyl ester carboxylesterase
LLTRELSIQCSGATLAGELSLPGDKSSYPTVLMIHGSGPLDRNENTRSQSLNVFNALADQLAANGIASFRYDKRGCAKSSGDYMRAGHSDLVDDASACVDHLATIDGCDPGKTFVLGHSEGTIIAAQLADRHRQLAGLILLCPFIEPMESILRRQSRQMQNDLKQAKGIRRFLYGCFFALFGDPVSSQEKLLTKLKTSDAPTFRVMLQKVNAKWLRELIALDNDKIYSKVTVPMLVIGGEKDLQCLPSDVARIAQVAPADVAEHVIPDLTHILRLDTEAHTFLSYGELLKLPIEPAVGEYASNWICDRID